MFSTDSRLARRCSIATVLVIGLVTCRASRLHAAPPECSQTKQLIQKGDRIAWYGSSSTRIGIWTKTVEFLLRTRHPELELEFLRLGLPGGKFKDALEHLDGLLDKFRPTVVFFNFGVNDAAGGGEELAQLKEHMSQCVAKVEARVHAAIFVTPQPADIRKSGSAAAANRTLSAETMLSHGRQQGWTVIDVHHSLDALQKANQAVDPGFTILKDSIHLTDAAYVAWGFFLYDRLDLPLAPSASTLTADGQITSTENCAVQDLVLDQGNLSFTRIDAVLPILPPVQLPARYSVPIETHSRYLLQVTGLAAGRYEIRCDERVLATVGSDALSVGVNINSLLLDAARVPPWWRVAWQVWGGRSHGVVGYTKLRFEVRKK